MNSSKLNFSIIVAMANNRAIGRDNQLLWHLPNDLKYFKKVTMDKPIVMGRKTFESIGRPLPGRDNLIITSKPELFNNYSIKSNNTSLHAFLDFNSLCEYLNETNNNQEVMIIGGGEIYKYFIDKVHKIYLTLVDTDLEADVYFPELDSSWKENFKQGFSKDDKHEYDYQFIELSKLI